MPSELRRSLTLLDATMINVGTIIGSGVFMAARPVAQHVPSMALGLLVWVVAGLFSLAGALTLAELGAALPEAGGLYVYLAEAYGPIWGFFYGWAECIVILGAGNAAVAVLLAAYVGHFFALGELGIKLVGAGCILALKTLNVVGLRAGVWTQNLVTLAKMSLIAALAAVALLAPAPAGAASPSLVHITPVLFGAALIQPLWAFDGWVYASCVGSEVMRPGRTLPLATISSVLIVSVLYLALNAGFLNVLGVAGAAGAELPAAAAAKAALGARGADVTALLVALSVLGSLNGGVITAPRVLYAMGKDGHLFQAVARVHPRFATPFVALILLGIVSAALVFAGVYDQLLTYAVCASWLFYAMGAAAVLVLRRRRPDLPRPYRAWGYPIVPLLFIAFAVGFLVQTLVSDARDALIGFGLVATGLVPYLIWRRRGRTARAAPAVG